MNKIKSVSLFLIAILSLSIFSGCDMTLNAVNASTLYNKYQEIVEEYTVYDGETIVAESSLFNANENLIITYKTSNLQNEIEQRVNDVNPSQAIFHVFDEEYPNTLYSSLAFFSQYRASLKNNANNWDENKLKNIYKALLDFRMSLSDFRIQKTALENLTITYNEQNLTSPYSYTTMVKYNDFKSAYNNLIEDAIYFGKLFEQAYTEDILPVDTFLTEIEVPYYELKRVSYTASLYTADAVYNYYVKHLGGFDAEGADKSLYNDMINLSSLMLQMQPLDNNALTDITTTGYYRVVRSHESQIIAQSDVYVSSVQKAIELNDSTNVNDIRLHDDYVVIINEATANYRNYISFAVELINQIIVD